MLKRTIVTICLAAAIFAFNITSATAKISSEEAARLGKDLTPMGGEPLPKQT